MLNQTNLIETQEIIKNRKKTVHCTCLPTSTVSQMNIHLSCLCSTIQTRRPWSGKQNLWQPIQFQNKEYILEPWKTSLQPLTWYFNYSIQKKTPCGSCMLSNNCQDQQTNTSLSSEYLLYKQALQMFHNLFTYSNKVWTPILQYKPFIEDIRTDFLMSKNQLRTTAEPCAGPERKDIYVLFKQRVQIVKYLADSLRE